MLIKISNKSNSLIETSTTKMPPRIRFYSFLLGLIALAHTFWLLNIAIESYQGETVYTKLMEFTQVSFDSFEFSINFLNHSKKINCFISGANVYFFDISF